MNPQSKIWIYQADRNLTEAEKQEIETKTQDFVRQWAAHGNQLAATAEVRHNRFVILMVDETMAGASGCSIDSSVHFIQSLGTAYQIDFFDRLQIAYLDQTTDSIQSFTLKDTTNLLENGTINQDTLVFSNHIKTKAELDNAWLLPIKDTWLKSKLKNTVG